MTAPLWTPAHRAQRRTRRGRAGAFFDVDRTLLRGSSFLALAGPLRRAGLISRRRLLAAGLHQLSFTLRGASGQKMEDAARAGAEAVRGIDAERLRRVAVEALPTALLPRLHADALRAIDAHHRAEEPVFLVSSAPAEIVEPLARAVGATDFAATRAAIAGGRYTGRLLEFCHGAAKYHAVHELAQRHGVDLQRSHAYADSFSDAPMLGAVGNPVAVNPDRDLRALAVRRGWRVARYRSSSTSRR